ncbi:MAG: hypothetical protein R2854_10560 [Caldilineaceae bacterium]
MRESGRAVVGVNGPGVQVFAVVDAMGVTPADCIMHSRESLYRLELDALVIPAALADERAGRRMLRGAAGDGGDLGSLPTAWRR